VNLLSVMGKSQIKSQSEITNHLTKRFKSLCQIRNQITKKSHPQITDHFNPNHKSNQNVNQM